MLHHVLQIASILTPGVADRVLDLFPRADRHALQSFDPNDGAVADEPWSGGPAVGLPATRAKERAQTMDGLLRSGGWESGPGRQTFKFEFDEWVHIVEGEAHVTAAGETRSLRAGDVALFRAGLEMTWEIPEYVRKVWVHRHRRRLLARLARSTKRRLRPGA